MRVSKIASYPFVTVYIIRNKKRWKRFNWSLENLESFKKKLSQMLRTWTHEIKTLWPWTPNLRFSTALPHYRWRSQDSTTRSCTDLLNQPLRLRLKFCTYYTYCCPFCCIYVSAPTATPTIHVLCLRRCSK